MAQLVPHPMARIGRPEVAPAAEPAAIQQLIEVNAPAADWREYLRANPAQFSVPPLHASDDDLLEYWRWRESEEKPDAQTQLRLLEIVERSPAEFVWLSR